MNPKPLVALNHFTVPMLTGVVPSQDRYSRSPLSDGLVRSNFWKGRQRLNRLYRWIANVVRPKIDIVILFQNSPQLNPEAHDFLIAPGFAIGRLCPGSDMIASCAISWQFGSRILPASKLAARRRTTRGTTTRTLVLVTEDQPAFFKVVG